MIAEKASPINRLRFLIIQTAWIGDAVLALPMAQELRRRHPEAEIHFLVRKGNESITENHPAIDVVWTWDKKENKYLNLLRLIFRLRKIPFSSIYNCQRYLSSGLLTLFLSAREKVGFDKNPVRFIFSEVVNHTISAAGEKIIHEVERNLSLIGDNFSEKRPRLYPGEKEHDLAQKICGNNKYIVIAPASAWFSKQLPIQSWIAFLKMVPAGLSVFIVGSKDEFAVGETLRQSHPSPQNLCGKLSLLESAAIMKGAVRVFVNDSGALHLASAVNAPVTAVFCSTVPRFGFGPLSDDSVVVETHENLPCRPCGLVGKPFCPQGHFRCGTGISVEALAQTLPHLPG